MENSNKYACILVLGFRKIYEGNSHNRILGRTHPVEYLLLRKEGKYGFPGGKTEGKETIYQTVRREVFEETGLELIGESKGLEESSNGLKVYCFKLIHSLTSKPKISLSSEHDKYVWWTEEKMRRKAHKLRGNTLKFFDRVIGNI